MNLQIMTYKDKTWCQASVNGGCGNKECTRNFTSEERQQAIQWWEGEDFPLAMGYFKDDSCGYVSIETLEIEGKE